MPRAKNARGIVYVNITILLLLVYLLRFDLSDVDVRLRVVLLSSSSSSLLELELVDVRVGVDDRVRELDDGVRLTLCDWVRVGVDLDDVTVELRCFVRSMVLLVRLEEDNDLL